ncbi:MAG: TadE/TadG family type IV pilus assembly protein [Candidatus Dormibacteria bacterium]
MSTRAGWRGQSLVEFAIVLPILLLLISGGVDLTRAFFVGIQISDASRQAALYAANNPDSYTQPELKAIAEENAGAGPLVCPGGDLHLTLGATSSDSSTSPGGAYYQPVTVVCDLPLLTPGLPSPVSIRASATALILP